MKILIMIFKIGYIILLTCQQARLYQKNYTNPSFFFKLSSYLVALYNSLHKR